MSRRPRAAGRAYGPIAVRPAAGAGVRLLAASAGQPVAAALRRRRGACPPGEWEDSGIDPARPPVFGGCARGELVAAGMLQDLAGALVHGGPSRPRPAGGGGTAGPWSGR